MTSTISRKQIISRSRDAGLDRFNQQRSNHSFEPFEDYEEMWFTHEHLFKEHISEVLRKWEQIDDEIWAKMIFMSRNRRIAKAYVRVPAVIIDGSENGFDGYRVGLNGFEDPFRDQQTEQWMSLIDKGCRIGIDDSGNVLIKRYSKSKVFVKSYPLDYSECCIGDNVIRSNGLLEMERKYTLFDIGKFEIAMLRELKSAYPDRRKLEQQCIVIVAFVRDHPTSILDLPIYVMFINIVALDLLKSKLNPVIYQSVKNRETRQSGYQLNQSSNNSKFKVPDFVSIFNNEQNKKCLRDSNGPADEIDDGFDGNFGDDREEPIYGYIGGANEIFENGGNSEDYYFSTTSNSINDYENNPFFRHHKRFLSRDSRIENCLMVDQQSGPRSMPTLNNIRYAVQPTSSSSNVPPKLPPRDRKKLSKQIDTIKSARKQQLNNSKNRIEIPSPDYHHDDQEEETNFRPSDHFSTPHDDAQTTKNDKKTYINPYSTGSRSRQQYHANDRGHPHPSIKMIRKNFDDIYDTGGNGGGGGDGDIIDDNSMLNDINHRIAMTMSTKNNGRRKHRSTLSAPLNNNNWPLLPSWSLNEKITTNGTITTTTGQQLNNSSNHHYHHHHHHAPFKTMSTTMRNNNRLMSFKDGSMMTIKQPPPPQPPPLLSTPSQQQQQQRSLSNNNLNRSLRVIDYLDEDPYYSGLEARLSSKKPQTSQHHPQKPSGTTKMPKGLNWMVRKVLSSNYINILTPSKHRHNNKKPSMMESKKKIPKSKSSNSENSDSDPYVSINDLVYEPIYGYTNPNGRVFLNGGDYSAWPTIQTTQRYKNRNR